MNCEGKVDMECLSNDEGFTLQSLWKAHKTGASSNVRLTGKKDLNWIIDTGASHHMTGLEEWFDDLRDISPVLVGMPNGDRIHALKKGSVTLGNLQLKDVLLVTNLTCNLISVSQLTCDLNCVVRFTNHVCVIQDQTSKTLIGAGEQREGLYVLKDVISFKANKTVKVDNGDLWHKRLGHPSMRIVELLSQTDNSIIINKESHKHCDICLRAKQTRVPFDISENKASDIFELIHCDLWGAYKEQTFCGASYFLTIVDDCSRGVWIYLLKEKTKVTQILKNFLSMTERQFGKQVKIVRSDNDTEFTCLTKYFHEKGTIHQTSMIGTPQQNGLVERKH